MFCLPALLCVELSQRETKMSIFKGFFNSDFPKIDPPPSLLLHLETIFSFVEIYGFIINPMAIDISFR